MMDTEHDQPMAASATVAECTATVAEAHLGEAALRMADMLSNGGQSEQTSPQQAQPHEQPHGQGLDEAQPERASLPPRPRQAQHPSGPANTTPVPAVLEPKVVVLRIKNPSLFTRTDVSAWVLRHMFVPRTVAELETENLAVMDFSVDSYSVPWLRHNQDSPYTMPHTAPSAFSQPHQRHHQQHAGSTEQAQMQQIWDNAQQLRVTSATSILTFASKHRLVVLVDTSPSMAIVDTSGRPKVHVSTAFDTICKCFDGLVRPFLISRPWGGPSELIEPELIVTVIADAGNAGHSTVSGSEDLPLRVLLQEVTITTRNIMAVAEKLYDAIIGFENVLLARGLRKSKDPAKLATAGVLPNEVHLELTIESLEKMGMGGNGAEAGSHPNHGGSSFLPSGSGTANPASGAQDTQRFSTRNSFSTLDAGLLALELLPSDAMPAIIYITDGVSPEWGSKDDIPRDICRKITRDYTRVNIVQVGSANGFSPDVNFGHVPNTEFLHFLAQALNGVFVYASDCPYIAETTDPLDASIGGIPPSAPGSSHPGPGFPASASTQGGSSFLMSPAPFMASSTSASNQSAHAPHQSLQAAQLFNANFFHRMFVFREFQLERKLDSDATHFQLPVTGGIRLRPVDTPRSRHINTRIDPGENITSEEMAFPWSPISKPPVIAEILCGYRDYMVPQVRLADLMAARLREGFRVQSIHSYRKSSRANDRIEIIMAMPWLMNVTIQYTIKLSWPISDPGTARPLAQHSVLSKPLKIELNVLAHHAFAMLFINVQSFEQLDGTQSSFHGKLMQLNAFLKAVSDADDAIKVFSAFNSRQTLALVGPARADHRSSHSTRSSASGLPLHTDQFPGYHSIADVPSNYWQFLTQSILERPFVLDEWKCPIILRSTSSQRNPGDRAISFISDRQKSSQKRRQVATYCLSTFLSRWCLPKTNYIKFVFGNPDSPVPTGFCLLHLNWETECLILLSMYSFAVGASGRRKLVAELTSKLSSVEHTSRSINFSIRPLVVCQKPIHKLMVRYDLQPLALATRSQQQQEQQGRQQQHDALPALKDSRGIGGLAGNTPLQETPSHSPPLLRPPLSFESAFRLQSLASRPYLRLRRWVWFADIEEQARSSFEHSSMIERIQQQAFMLLYNSRLDDMFIPVSEVPGCVTFYREMDVCAGNNTERPCAVQFVLLWNAEQLLFVTELWVEPLLHAGKSSEHHVDGNFGCMGMDDSQEDYTEYYNDLALYFGEQDRNLLARVFAFEYIQEIGHGSVINHKPLDRATVERLQSAYDPHDCQIVATQFYLPAMLQDALFAVSVYHVLSIDDGCDEDPLVHGLEVHGQPLEEATECVMAPLHWCQLPSSWHSKYAPHGLGFLPPVLSYGEASPATLSGPEVMYGGMHSIVAQDAPDAPRFHLHVPRDAAKAKSRTQGVQLLTAVCPIPITSVTANQMQSSRSNAILYGFLAESLSAQSNLVIKWPHGQAATIQRRQSGVAHPDHGIVDLLDHLRSAVCDRYRRGSVFLVRNISKSIGFVKFVNDDKFIIAMLHVYELPMAEHPLRDMAVEGVEQPQDEASLHETHYFSVTLFECTRPTRPVSRALVSRPASLQSPLDSPVSGSMPRSAAKSPGAAGSPLAPVSGFADTSASDSTSKARPGIPVYLASLACDSDGRFIRLPQGFLLAKGGRQHDDPVTGNTDTARPVGPSTATPPAGTVPILVSTFQSSASDGVLPASESVMDGPESTTGSSPQSLPTFGGSISASAVAVAASASASSLSLTGMQRVAHSRGFSNTTASSAGHDRIQADTDTASAMSGFSPEACMFMDTINSSYAAAFAKTLFLSLMQGATTTEKDVGRAFRALELTTVTIDLTAYLDSLVVMDARRNSGRFLDDNTQASGIMQGGQSTLGSLSLLSEPEPTTHDGHAETGDGTGEPSGPTTTPAEAEIKDAVYEAILLQHFEHLSDRSASKFASQFLFYRPGVLPPCNHAANGSPEAATGRSQRLVLTNLDSPEAIEQYRVLVETADTPLFVDIECQFRRGDVTVSKPAFHSLPLAYPAELDVSDEHSSGAEAVQRDLETQQRLADGTTASDVNSPQESSASSTPTWKSTKRSVQLCINCWTLKAPIEHPGVSPSGPYTSRAQSGFASTSTPTHAPATTARSPQACAAAFGAMQVSDKMRQSLETLKVNIEHLARERILRSLLQAGKTPPESASLYYADSLIRARHADDGVKMPDSTAELQSILASDSVHLEIPLSFLDQGVCLGFFRSSLTQYIRSNIEIHQIGEACYYLLDVRPPDSRSPRKYWAFLLPRLSDIHFYFYCAFLTPLEREDIVRYVAEAVRSTVERANRLKLLHDLNETHLASDLLVPASQADMADPEYSISSSPGKGTPDLMLMASRTKYPPGHFACPLVFEHVFPFHWRVRPIQAINVIVMSILPLSVSNRKGLFVYATKSSVFYIQIQVAETAKTTASGSSAAIVSASAGSAGGDPGVDDPASVPLSTVYVDSRERPPSNYKPPSQQQDRARPTVAGVPETVAPGTAASAVLNSAVEQHTSNHGSLSRSRVDQSLVLLVYGVDKPGPEITVEFVNMMHSRLQGLTQGVLGTFLSRNISSKLTRADIDFILPVSKGVDPLRTIQFLLPPELENPHLFFLLLRQTLLTFAMPLTGHDVATALLTHYERSTGQAVIDACVRNGYNELHVGDLSFLYNSVPPRYSSQLETAVGHGIAAIVLTPYSREGRVMFPSRGVSTLQNTRHIDLDNFVPVVRRLDSSSDGRGGKGASGSNANEQSMGEFKVVLEIWSPAGALNLDALVDKISTLFENTAADYAVESYFRSTNWTALPLHESLRDDTAGSDSPEPEMFDSIDQLTPVGGAASVRGSLLQQSSLGAPMPPATGSSMVAHFTMLTSMTGGHGIDHATYASSLTSIHGGNVGLSREPETLIDVSQFETPLVVLPKMLETATAAGNPAVQTFKVATELPLNAVASGMLDVLQEEGLQLYLFSRDCTPGDGTGVGGLPGTGGQLRYITASLPHESLEIFLSRSLSNHAASGSASANTSPLSRTAAAAALGLMGIPATPMVPGESVNNLMDSNNASAGLGYAQEYVIVAATSFVRGTATVAGSAAAAAAAAASNATANNGTPTAISSHIATHGAKRKGSLGSDLASTTSSVMRDRDRESVHSMHSSIIRQPHMRQNSAGDDTASESSSTSGSPMSGLRSSRHNLPDHQLDDLFMFGDPFVPSFPMYDKRSSFLVVSLASESVSVYSYNWKRSECERVFLKTLKLLNWCKIHYQFQTRKLKYTGLHLEQDRDRDRMAHVSEFGERAYSTAVALNSTENTALMRPERRFRRLDFIYHIGGYDAINLQKQIVDFIEVFFRYGKRVPMYSGNGTASGPGAVYSVGAGAGGYSAVGFPMVMSGSVGAAGGGGGGGGTMLSRTPSGGHGQGHHYMQGTASAPMARLRSMGSIVSASGSGGGGLPDQAGGNALSLNEMSEVLQSIRLIHSASAPMFFSEYRDDLVEKWEAILRAPRLDDPNVLRLASTKLATAHASVEGQTLDSIAWYKTMISDFLVDYVGYLELLGMERVPWDLVSSLESGQHGGTFAIAPKFVIEAPSVFLRRFFPAGVILVQCGFYTYFATINVLTFAYRTDGRVVQDVADADYEAECAKMKTLPHIVSFSYDFHLRYVHDKLRVSSLPMPLDILPMLRSFVQLNPRKARFARNRILHGRYRVGTEDGASAASLFTYILRNPQTYGFEPVVFSGERTACMATTMDPSLKRPPAPRQPNMSGSATSLSGGSIGGDSAAGLPPMPPKTTRVSTGHADHSGSSHGTSGAGSSTERPYSYTLILAAVPPRHPAPSPGSSQAGTDSSVAGSYGGIFSASQSIASGASPVIPGASAFGPAFGHLSASWTLAADRRGNDGMDGGGHISSEYTSGGESSRQPSPSPQQQQARAAALSASLGSETNESSVSSSTDLEIEYFLLIVNTESPFPHLDVDAARAGMEQAIVDEPMREYIGGGYYLHDIAKNVTTRISSLVDQATKYFGRDSLWAQLIAARPPGMAVPDTFDAAATDQAYRETQTPEWTLLFFEKTGHNARNLALMDRTLAQLFNDRRLPWTDILAYLSRVYGSAVRRLPAWSTGGPSYVFLINPANDDYMVQFAVHDDDDSDDDSGSDESASDDGDVYGRVDLDGATRLARLRSSGPHISTGSGRRVRVEGFALSREGIPDAVELRHVNDVVNSILYYVWTETLA